MAQLGDVEGLARVLAVSGCDLEEEDPHGLRALQVAARHGHADAVELLLDEGADPSATASNGWTVTHIAARYGHALVLKQLLPSPDLHACDLRGRTPLHLAALSGCPHTLLFLLHSGANISDVDNNGQTVLHLVCEKGHALLLQVVLSWDGLDVEELLRTDKLEQNVFHYAAACGDTRMLSLLLARLEMGRTKPPELMRALNKASASGWTPLSCAVVHARTSTVHLLVEHGAIVDPSVQEAAQKCAAQQRAAATDETQQMLLTLAWRSHWFGG